VSEGVLQPRVGFWEVLAVGCELVMLGSLAAAGWAGADGVLPRLALAVALPGTAVAVWAVWTARTSPRRLAARWRLLTEVALFALTGAALAAVGHPWWGLGVVVISVADTTVLAVRDRTR